MAFVARLPEDGDHKGPVVILEKLIDNGARIEARNRQGETALHVAVRCGRKLAVRTLVKRGASVHARNAAGRSVLDVADSRMFWSRNQEKEYSHYEACRAWLSGEEARAVQQPTVAQEWAWREL
ncbi:Acyl-CoA-binding domain-containing protein 2 like [Verticillium longisporum]|nr:Acyl-CoA-binding domain-containing protein 2 like [Verticillium longisporum]